MAGCAGGDTEPTASDQSESPPENLPEGTLFDKRIDRTTVMVSINNTLDRNVSSSVIVDDPLVEANEGWSYRWLVITPDDLWGRGGGYGSAELSTPLLRIENDGQSVSMPSGGDVLGPVWPAPDHFSDMPKEFAFSLQPGMNHVLIMIRGFEADINISVPDPEGISKDSVLEGAALYWHYYTVAGEWDHIDSELYTHVTGYTSARHTVQIKHEHNSVFLGAMGDYNILSLSHSDGFQCTREGPFSFGSSVWFMSMPPGEVVAEAEVIRPPHTANWSPAIIHARDLPLPALHDSPFISFESQCEEQGGRFSWDLV